MIANVLISCRGDPMGVVLVDKEQPSMYDQRDAVKLWLETYLDAVDIDFKPIMTAGPYVTFTTGGKAPYRSSADLSRVVEHVTLSKAKL